jgi:hypothetical protein
VSPMFIKKGHCIVIRVVPSGKRKFMLSAQLFHNGSHSHESVTHVPLMPKVSA